MTKWKYQVVRMDTLDLFKGHVELLGKMAGTWSTRSTLSMQPSEDRARKQSRRVRSGLPFSNGGWRTSEVLDRASPLGGSARSARRQEATKIQSPYGTARANTGDTTAHFDIMLRQVVRPEPGLLINLFRY